MSRRGKIVSLMTREEHGEQYFAYRVRYLPQRYGRASAFGSEMPPAP